MVPLALALAIATAPRCQTAQLGVAPTFYGVGLGQFFETFTFVNSSRRTCSLSGWPRVRVQPEVRQFHTLRVQQGKAWNAAVRTVTLHPRQAASFNVYGADWNSLADRPCPTTRTVDIRPTDATSVLLTHVKLPNCSVFYIAPLVKGTRDRDAWSIVLRP